jgi:hypothetical protein
MSRKSAATATSTVPPNQGQKLTKLAGVEAVWERFYQVYNDASQLATSGWSGGFRWAWQSTLSNEQPAALHKRQLRL